MNNRKTLLGLRRSRGQIDSTKLTVKRPVPSRGSRRVKRDRLVRLVHNRYQRASNRFQDAVRHHRLGTVVIASHTSCTSWCHGISRFIPEGRMASIPVLFFWEQDCFYISDDVRRICSSFSINIFWAISIRDFLREYPLKPRYARRSTRSQSKSATAMP